MSDNEQIEKDLERWVKVCPFSRSETAKQEAYVAGYKTGVKAERERIAGTLDILASQEGTPLEFQGISDEFLDGLIRNSERVTAILKKLKEAK